MISPAYRQRAARALFGSARSTLIPATLWLGWIGTSGSEVTTTRTRVPNTDATFGASGAGVTNVAPIDAGVAEGAWFLRSVGFWDAATGGTLVVTADLPAARSVAEDEPLVIATGALTLEVGA